MKITKVSLSLIIALLVGCQLQPTPFESGAQIKTPWQFENCGETCVEKPVGTAGGSSTLQDVHDWARSKHEYILDVDHYGNADLWVPNLRGDCEDFALVVRDRLRAMGVEAHLAWVIDETNAHHMVAVTPSGWVLDNRKDWVVRRDDLQYRWLKINQGRAWYLIR